MTEGQDEDDRRFRRYLARGNLASVMNDTKWRELVAMIQAIDGYRPRFRVKCVRDREPDGDGWEQSFPFHIPTFKQIEWIEFDPLVQIRGAVAFGSSTDFSQQIEVGLAALNVQFYRVANMIRVNGYVRPTQG
jgi:hypothetical protein